ncbi:hypothetical protein J1N35_036242 [Gossypium stocksii]|uniref:Glutaredoxin domain-containing protein n=1 Tax=Gossypium stocksii TaxID=47602 RepID=A0A9D3UHP3_9ROSI|nr:hypothetical protein J1N35_036242 [Gossypium stocksii]
MMNEMLGIDGDLRVGRINQLPVVFVEGKLFGGLDNIYLGMKMEIIDVRKAGEEAESTGNKRGTNMPHSTLVGGFLVFGALEEPYIC